MCLKINETFIINITIQRRLRVVRQNVAVRADYDYQRDQELRRRSNNQIARENFAESLEEVFSYIKEWFE